MHSQQLKEVSAKNSFSSPTSYSYPCLFNIPGCFLIQVLCRCCFFCLKHSSPRFSCGCLISNISSLERSSLTPLSKTVVYAQSQVVSLYPIVPFYYLHSTYYHQKLYFMCVYFNCFVRTWAFSVSSSLYLSADHSAIK